MTTTTTLKFADVKAALPDLYNKELDAQARATTDKQESVARLVETMAGLVIQRGATGNAVTISATLAAAKKNSILGRLKLWFETAIAAQPPSGLRTSSIDDVATFAQHLCDTAMAAAYPAPKTEHQPRKAPKTHTDHVCAALVAGDLSAADAAALEAALITWRLAKALTHPTTTTTTTTTTAPALEAALF